MPCSHLSDYPLGALTLVLFAAVLSACAGISSEFLMKVKLGRKGASERAPLCHNTPRLRTYHARRGIASPIASADECSNRVFDCGFEQEDFDVSIFVQNALLYGFGVLFNLAFIMQSSPGLITEGLFFQVGAIACNQRTRGGCTHSRTHPHEKRFASQRRCILSAASVACRVSSLSAFCPSQQ